MSTILILALIFTCSFSAAAVFLWLGARWARIPQITFKRCLATMFLLGVIQVLLVPMNVVSKEQLPALPSYFLPLVELIVGLLITWLVIKWMFQTSYPRAVLAWLPTLIVTIASIAFIFLVIKPYVMEPFIMPTNSMAPTIVGPHQIGECPTCGHSLIVPYYPDRPTGWREPDQEELGICKTCLKTSKTRNRSAEVCPPDRFACNKLLSPRRWDLVVFRTPGDPSILWVKRVIGMPGENVVIKDGAVWINDAKLSPPEAIARLQFMEQPEGGFGGMWGSPERPVQLGEEEYFVVGDFTLRSSDSRMWGPVPRSKVVGIATLIYWPPSRWRVIR